MTPSREVPTLLRRHLMALDAALTRLERHGDIDQTAYLANLDLQWTVERGLLVSAQCVLDIATHLCASAGVDAPDYTASIDALGQLGILPAEFARGLRALAGFRNVLVHAYLSVDQALVHAVLTQRLGELREFAEHVEGWLAR